MDHTGISFVNNVEDGTEENIFLFRNFYNGGGVAIGDINNDGLADIFFTSNIGDNKLYLNKGSFNFEDITNRSSIKQDNEWCTGVVFADVNNDGWLDIYVCSSGHMSTGQRKNKLYINNHNLTFTESAAAYGLDIKGYCTQVSFFDYDMDGDLDMFLINNSPIPVNQLGYSNRRDLEDAKWPVADSLKGGGDHLYRNDNGHYTEVTKQTGIHGSLISFGLGVSVGDVNNDGYPDVYVSNDSYERDYLYINQKNGTFKDQLEECMQHTSYSSMGADIADINNDGYSEVFTTDMLPDNDYRLKTLGSFDNIDLYRGKVKSNFYHQFMQNGLQLNNGNGTFSEIAKYSGVDATDWSWGALMFDADNDGLNDIYVCNGVNRDVTNLDFMDFFANDLIQKMEVTGKKERIEEVLKKIPRNPLPNKAFKNKGNLQFSDAGEKWGFTQSSYSNGAAYGDLDNDGDLDLVVNNENQPAFIYKNNSRELNKNNYISISLKGDSKNTFAIGSIVKIYAGNQIMARELVPSRGFQSSVDYKVVVGLGSITKIDSLIITWPNLRQSKYYQPAINQLHEFLLTDAKNFSPDSLNQHVSSSVLLHRENAFDKHEEDDYVDFYYERNLPEMLSREGPKATCGDVNKDGLQDIYIGGAAGHGGQLYLQTPTGTFIKKENADFKQFADFEDVAVLFFDCDNDGDLDLVIGPGGNNVSPISRQMQLCLFKNDGKGNFEIDPSAFANNEANIAVIKAYDFDNDGDLDLFVGGRSVPRQYGTTPSSYTYVNDGKGHFIDIAKTKNPDIAAVGMIKDAVWADVSGDKNKELIIVGEWMPPRIFSFSDDRFIEVKTNISDLYGWWQAISVSDLNGDGKMDIILGNIGENFYLHPDKEHPVKLWINDFNQNNTIDKVLTRTVDSKDRPVYLKHEMEDQIPKLKKLSLRHEDFAKKNIQELFVPEILNKSVIKLFNYSSSCIAFNDGNGKFSLQKMPPPLQLSSVNAVKCVDVNGDGFTDFVTGGNLFIFPPQLGRLDAGFGNILLNDGKGKFTCMTPAQSGLNITGEVRDIVEITKKGKSYLLFLRNDDHPVMYQLNSKITFVNK